MKHKLLLVFVFITISISAQNILWQNTIGGNDYEWCNFIELTSDGNYISGGYSYSNISGDKNENSRGLSDFWFFKIDNSSGNLLWQKTIGGNGNDDLTSAKETLNGDFILGGYSSSRISGEKTQNSRGGDDYWIVKLDANRNIIWDKTFGGTGTDRLRCIIETEDGGYLIGGESDSNISGDKNEASKGDIDIWLIKIDDQGSIVWQKTIGGDGIDLVSSIIKTPDHNYVLAGSSSSTISGDKTQSSKGGSDYWILKLAPNGTIIWQNTIGGNNGDNAKAAVATSDGNYIIGGDSFSNISGDKTENTNNNSTDVWLIKLNNNGQLIWQKDLGGNSTEILANMKLTSDNGLVLGIMSYSGISGIKTEASRGDRDYWIVKLDSNNNFEWDKTIGGSSIDQPQSIVQSNDGNYVIAGWTQSNISGDKTENLNGTLRDIWIVKFNVCNQALPTANSPQTFCTQQNPTLNSITITGQNIKWYDALTAGMLLPNTTLLQNGKTYYASQTINGCESERTPVTITIQNTLAPTGNTNQTFCTAQNPTIADMQITGNSIKWYDALTNGTLLTASTSLQNGKTYYASQTINNCESPRFGVTISITNTPPAPAGNTGQTFCKSENATLSTIQISGQNIKWYDSSTSTTVLSNATLLENNKTYYASQTIGCESARTAVLVKINDPALPSGSNNQQFCIYENATITNLNISGNNLKWYDAAINGNNLQESALQNGVYYVTQTLNNCESERYAVTVKIQDTQMPIADSPQVFCIQKNALIRDIAITGQNIKWFQTETATASLSESLLLENGITYYASQMINNCESERIPVTINILPATFGDCISFVEELPYPKFFTPNNDGFHDYWTIDFAYLAPNTPIRIFDRYGKFIKEIIYNSEGWNGTLNGQPLPSTDYWFVVIRKNGTEFRGHFSLKR